MNGIIKNKYKIYEKKFGYVNWIGLWTLYKKEVLRFLIVAVQTVVSPLVTSLLFLLVLSLAIGNDRNEVLGFPFITFLAPGLIAMQVIQQAFSHSSSSIMIGKIQGNIVDILYAPLNAFEITVEIEYYNFLYILIFTFFGGFILSSIGIIVGLYSEKFDQMAGITNFIIVPLSFLSGTFYSIDRLPDVLKNISEANPFFYIIDGFRYGFLGVADGAVQFGLIYTILLSFITWFTAYILFRKGYKIKS